MNCPCVYKLFLCLIFYQTSILSFSQSTALKGGYLGQKPPGNIPVMFAPGVISTQYYEHSSPAFSPDGQSVFWTVIYSRQAPARLMEMHQEKGIWGNPTPASFGDTTADEFYPSFSADGNTLYFSSRRRMSEGYVQTRGTLRLWKTEMTSSGWGRPVPMDTAVFQPEDYAHSITNSGKIYTSFRKNNGRIFDIACYEKTPAGYNLPAVLPYNINSSKTEDGAFIAADESFLIFASSRPGGMNGSTDLYISFRTKNGGWTAAFTMGPTINSKYTERFPRVSPDGKYLFFGSDRDLKPGAEGTDVYWVDAQIISQIKNQVSSGQEKPIETNSILNALYNNDSVKLEPFLKSWISQHPGDINGYIDYYAFLRNKNRFETANTHLQKIDKKLLLNDDLKVEAALVKYGAGRISEAIELVSKLPAKGLENRFRFIHLASALYAMKLFKESAGYYKKAIAIQPRGGDFYNMACSYSLYGDTALAFEALNSAVDHGFNLKNDFEKDPDLYALKAHDKWSALMAKLEAPFNGPSPYRRAHHELVYDEADHSVLLFGGSTPYGSGQYKFFNDMWSYDVNGWKKTGNKGDERSGMRLAFHTKQNKTYSYGGFTADNQSSGQLRVFENNDWRILTDVPIMKSAEGGFVYDSGRDKLIAFGGSSGRGIVNGITWEWDGVEWKKFDGQSPQARQAFVMAYDHKRNKTILYGGMDGTGKIIDDGIWEFDGSGWANIRTAFMPAPRMLPGYAFDSKRGALMVFGGADSKGLLGDTWSWDGVEWKKLADQGPSLRVMGYMAYDKNRDRIVLFGGRLGAPGDAGDTWEWDGIKWMEIKGSK